MEWKCACGQVFSSRRKLQAHRKNCELAYSKRANPHIEATCPYCGLHKSFTNSAFTLHKKYCKENPNCEKCKGHKVSEETKRKISQTAKSRHSVGGYREGSGRGKKGTYKGYWCDSSWELAYVVYNLDHNISFKRNTEKFSYKYHNEVHNYIPDFIEEDTYIEIKGFYTEQVMAKAEQFPYKLKFLDSNGIKPYIDYVIKKYGQDFIKLYN